MRSQPGHQRGVDDVGNPLPADRFDGGVDVLEPEPMRGDELERETLGGELCQSELAGLVAVAARALHGDELHREFFQREIGNAASSPCATMTPPLRLSASMPSRIGMVPAPAVQSSATSTPLPPVISMTLASGSSLLTSMT